MKMDDSKHITRVKVYRISIDTAVLPTWMKNVWYAKKNREEFTAILTCKEIESGYVPRFQIIDRDGERISIPVHYRMVRPEDCQILWERIFEVSTSFYKKVLSTSTKSKEDRENGEKKANA